MGLFQRHRDHSNRNFPIACYCAVAVAAALAVLGWIFQPGDVRLSDDAYDVAVALYRACNQQDQQGLEQVRKKLDELIATESEASAIMHLRGIIDQAESGQWTVAMRHARNALAAQTGAPSR